MFRIQLQGAILPHVVQLHEVQACSLLDAESTNGYALKEITLLFRGAATLVVASYAAPHRYRRGKHDKRTEAELTDAYESGLKYIAEGFAEVCRQVLPANDYRRPA